MTKTKHFIDDNHLIRNSGYKKLDQQINEFITSLGINVEVIDIKYSSIFNPMLSDIYGNNGIIQFSAILIYNQ